MHGRYNNLVTPDTSLRPPEDWPLETGMITEVNQEEYTCRVLTESGRDILEASYMTPWFSFSGGHGMYTMPEADSRVVIAQMMNGQWIILGFIPLEFSDENFSPKNGRRDLHEGDVCFSTGYGNYIEVRKHAGCIVLQNNEVCKIIMDSKENQIFLYSQRLYILNSAGSVEMTTDKDGNTVTVGMFRKKLDDDKNFVKIMMGTTGVENTGKYSIGADGTKSTPSIIFSINICNKASLTVDTEGNVISYCNSREDRVEGDATLIANGIIRDRSAKDIRHEKMQRAKLRGVVDPEIAEYEKYNPSATPVAPSGDMSPTSPGDSGMMKVGEDPASVGEAPKPTKGGRIVLQATEDSVRNGSPYKAGTMTIFNADGTPSGSYGFVNGPWQAGAIPYGEYTVSPVSDCTEVGYAVYDPANGAVSGWRAQISDVYDPKTGRNRAGLFIHPDGNSPGTNGCIGILGSVSTLEDCRSKLEEVLKETGGSCKMEYVGPMGDGASATDGKSRGGSIVDLVKHFEGFDPVAKWDYKQYSVGYGHGGNIDGVPVTAGTTIDRATAERMLQQDLERAASYVDRYVKVPLTPYQRAALSSFVFNLGPGRLQESTLLKKLNAGDYEGAKEQFSEWNKAGGEVLPGLVKRRAAEAHYFATGEVKY